MSHSPKKTHKIETRPSVPRLSAVTALSNQHQPTKMKFSMHSVMIVIAQKVFPTICQQFMEFERSASAYVLFLTRVY